MKLDLTTVVSERNRIINSFTVPVEHTLLVATETDTADHRYWLEKVYSKLFIVEAGVVDDCCRRLEREFGGWN